MFTKAATDGISEEMALLLAKAEAVSIGIDPETITITKGTTPMPKLPDEVFKSLDPSVQAHITAMEKAAASHAWADSNSDGKCDVEGCSMAKSEHMSKAADPAPAPTGPEAERLAFEKAVNAMDPAVREMFKAQQKETAAATALAKALWDDKQDAHFETMAKELVNLPGIPPTGYGSVLRKASEALGDETFEELFKSMKGADAAVKMSKAFEEVGSGHGGSGNAGESLEALAKELQTADPNMTLAEAMVKAATSRPDLYTQHREENIAINRGATITGD